MSWLDSLFGGGGNSGTQTVDAFSALPQEFKDLLLAEAAAAKNNVNAVADARVAYSDPNRAVAPLNGVEQAGLGRVTDNIPALDAVEGMGLDAIIGAGAPIAGMSDIDVGAFAADYENPFTDAVVGTTLDRMDRDLMRRNLADESAAAALGGTTNSRRAVAQSLDREATEREKASIEAEMRAAGFDRARQFGLDRGAFELDLADTEAGRRLDMGDAFGRNAAASSARGLAEGSYMQTFGEKLRGLDQARFDAPRDALTWQASLLGNVQPPGSQSSTVTSSGGNSWAQLAGAGLGAYALLR